MSQEPPPLAPRIAEDDSDDEDPATELNAAGDTRRIIDGIIQPARTVAVIVRRLRGGSTHHKANRNHP